jgi:hypothetical protein
LTCQYSVYAVNFGLQIESYEAVSSSSSDFAQLMPIERIVEEVKVKKSSSSLGGESQEKNRDRSKGRNFQKPALNRKAKVSTKSS